MKNRRAMIKKTAVGLCAVLVLGSFGGAIYTRASEMEENTASLETEVAEQGITGEISTDETVYILADAQGATQKIIVSDWLKNQSSEDTYTQENVEKALPVDMTVTYTLDGKKVTPEELAGKSGALTIRYDYTNNQYEEVEIDGKTQKIYVPFAVLTGMVLDNEVFTNVEVTGGKILNDGGRTVVVGIAFPGLQGDLELAKDKLDIPDHLEIQADVKDFKLNVTYTVATNEVFQDVDADRLDSFGDMGDKLDELTDGMNQLLDGSGQLYDGLCTLYEKSGDLADGVTKLDAGALELKKGASDLDNGVGQLQDGAAKLAAGLSTLSSKNGELNGGARQVFESLLSMANTQLAVAGLEVPTLTIENYADVLNTVITSLDENQVYQKALDQVTAAVEAKRPFIREQVTAAVKEQVTAAVKAQVEPKVVEAVKAQVEPQVTAAVKAQVETQVTASVRAQVEAQVWKAITGMDKESYMASVSDGDAQSEVIAAVENAINGQMQSDAVQKTIADNVAAQMQSETVKKTIADNVEAQLQSDALQKTIADNVEAQMASAEVQAIIDGQMQSDEIQKTIDENTELQVQKAIAENMAGEEVQSILAAASEGAKSVISLKASLDSYNAFYLGLQAYTAGVAEAANGAGTLKNGLDTLKAGSSKLSGGASGLADGTAQLKQNIPTLLDGVAKLKDGAGELADGLKEFDEKGIQKLVRVLGDDLQGSLDRMREVLNVSKNYRSFSEDNAADGQVKFIYRTEEIK